MSSAFPMSPANTISPKPTISTKAATPSTSYGGAVIKVWFTGNAKAKYPFNSNWPEIKSLVDLAQTTYYKNLFDQPIGTFILETYAPGREEHYYLAGMSPEQIREREKNDIRDAAAYLLQTYKGSGKTFILQNWEGGLVPPRRRSRQRSQARGRPRHDRLAQRPPGRH